MCGDQDPSLLALFAAGARFNHSCAPNATLESSKSTLLVRAGCAIPMGSEARSSQRYPAMWNAMEF